MKKIIVLCITIILMLSLSMVISCRQSDKVSYNLSYEADSFNVTRRLTAINVRTNDIIFEMKGNFSLDVDYDYDLNIIGENPDGTFYKHFIRLTPEVTYVVEDIGTNAINKYQYEINFNPKMIRQIAPTIID